MEGKAAAAAAASAVIAKAARAAMAPLLQLHLERRERVASGMAEGGRPSFTETRRPPTYAECFSRSRPPTRTHRPWCP